MKKQLEKTELSNKKGVRRLGFITKIDSFDEKTGLITIKYALDPRRYERKILDNGEIC